MNLQLHLQENPIRLQPPQGAAVVLPLSLADLLAAGLHAFPPQPSALEQAIQEATPPVGGQPLAAGGIRKHDQHRSFGGVGAQHLK